MNSNDDKKPLYFTNVEKCVDEIIDYMGKTIVFGMPLALGKSYDISNELYKRAKIDKSINLTIVTALSLEKPYPKSEIEKRMLAPILDRIWQGVKDFDYMLDLRKNCVPKNVTIKEFYCKPGANKKTPLLQQNHYSSNYTHVARDMMLHAENLVYCHSIARKEVDGKILFSDSCNADLSTDIEYLIPKAKKEGKKGLIIGHVNNFLPFMEGDAVNEPEHFDVILDSEEYYSPLFSVPKEPVTNQDYAIGIHVSTLIPDDGTLQIGIGSLGDAIVKSILLRDKSNKTYLSILKNLEITYKYEDLINRYGGFDPFEKGLFAATEMLVEAFMILFNEGILKRKVYESKTLQKLLNDSLIDEYLAHNDIVKILKSEDIYPFITEKKFYELKFSGVFKDKCLYKDYTIRIEDKIFDTDLRNEKNLSAIIETCCNNRLKNGHVLHGGFFIGSNNFYDNLRNLTKEERSLINMTGVKKINQLYGDEKLRSIQRKNARFINTAMMATVSGAAVSDALDDGTIISGVGGQYNFVSMAHALESARSILMVRSFRHSSSGIKSNIVYNYGHTTIPNHLKDIVITEYGIADLKGKTDEEVIKEMLNITDSRFQKSLLKEAIKNRKLKSDYKIPPLYRNNYPEVLDSRLKPFKENGMFPLFPFGTEFTDTEISLGKALKKLKMDMETNKLRTLKKISENFFVKRPSKSMPYLQRMGLEKPSGIKEWILAKMIVMALQEADII